MDHCSEIKRCKQLIHNNMDWSQGHYVEWKNPVSGNCILYDSIYVTLPKRHIDSDGKRMHGCQGLAMGGGWDYRGIPELFGMMEQFCVQVLNLIQSYTKKSQFYCTLITYKKGLLLALGATGEHAVSGLYFLVKMAVEISLSRAAPGKKGWDLLWLPSWPGQCSGSPGDPVHYLISFKKPLPIWSFEKTPKLHLIPPNSNWIIGREGMIF